MAEGLGFAGMPYPTYGVHPVATAPPMATAISEPMASSSTYTGIHEPTLRAITSPLLVWSRPIFLAMQRLS